MTGLEPATPRSTVWCSNRLSYTHHTPKFNWPGDLSAFPKLFCVKNYPAELGLCQDDRPRKKPNLSEGKSNFRPLQSYFLRIGSSRRVPYFLRFSPSQQVAYFRNFLQLGPFRQLPIPCDFAHPDRLNWSRAAGEPAGGRRSPAFSKPAFSK